MRMQAQNEPWPCLDRREVRYRVAKKQPWFHSALRHCPADNPGTTGSSLLHLKDEAICPDGCGP